jgi:hypothetical protein
MFMHKYTFRKAKWKIGQCIYLELDMIIHLVSYNFFRHEGLCIGLPMPNHCFENKQPNSTKQCYLVIP